MANSVKITKKDMFRAIIAACQSDESIVKFCEHEIELLDKKSSAKSGKLTKAQLENEGIKESIIDALAAESEGITISDLAAKNADTLGGYSNQKISALMRQLIDEGKVVKTSDKKKSYFQLSDAAKPVASITVSDDMAAEGSDIIGGVDLAESGDPDIGAPEEF